MASVLVVYCNRKKVTKVTMRLKTELQLCTELEKLTFRTQLSRMDDENVMASVIRSTSKLESRWKEIELVTFSRPSERRKQHGL